MWNAAHEVTVKKIAPDAIINDNYEFLYNLLSELSTATKLDDSHEDQLPSANRIIDWNTKGRVFYDFINLDMEVRTMLKNRDEEAVGYFIEKLRPQVRI